MIETRFKETEVGKIPEDWEVKPLGDVLSVGNGRDYKHLPLGEVPVYGTGGYMTSVSDYLYDGETVCIGRKGTIDEPQYHTGKIWTVDTLFYTYGFKKVCVKYLFYLFNRIDWKKYNEATGVPSLTSKNILNITAPFPNLSEQQRIATALSNIDVLISELGKLIEKKQIIKQGAMQKLLLGKNRLKGYAKSSNYKQSAIGNIPIDWSACPIKNCTDVVTGATPSTTIPEYWKNGTIRWMSSGELNNKYIYDVQGRITNRGYDNSGTHMIPKYCVLIGLAGQGKTRGTAAYNLVELCTNQSIAAILPNNKLFDSLYLYYYMDSQYKQLRELSAGDGGRGGLNKKLLLNFVIPLPPIDEQTAIASVLSSMDKEISTLEVKRDKYVAIKAGMMQQLLTGKIRLVDNK